jgi:hypothetical protein
MLLYPFLILLSCSGPSSSESEWLEIPVETGTTTTTTATTTVSTTTTTDTGYLEETGSTAIVPEAGDWGMAKPQILSDSCGVNNYQDVVDFVPKTLSIIDPTEDGFDLDDSSSCVLIDDHFVCDTQEASASTLGDTATMIIESTLSGDVKSSTLLDTWMDVVILECEGAGCFLIELALTFPCPIELQTQASKL